MAELLLDSRIRLWVFLPIMIITFLFGIIKHYLFVFVPKEQPIDIGKIGDSQALLRSKYLTSNGRFIPLEGFMARKNYFINDSTGLLAQKRPPGKLAMTDPEAVAEMLKKNFYNMFPMIMIGNWINWFYAGFLCTKLPFPLTHKFKIMFQRNIKLVSLDASWVSAASWYMVNLFCLGGVYKFVLGNTNAADQTKVMPDEFIRGALLSNGDFNQEFKKARNALKITEHEWIVGEIEENFFEMGQI